MTRGNADTGGGDEVQLEGFACEDKSGIVNNFGSFFSNIGCEVQNSEKIDVIRCKNISYVII